MVTTAVLIRVYVVIIVMITVTVMIIIIIIKVRIIAWRIVKAMMTTMITIVYSE